MVAKQYKKAAVLLVDSVHTYRQYIVSILRDAGIVNVVVVGGAEEAIHTLSNRHFDIIISEYDLANGKNGLQLLEELKHKKLLDLTLFVFLSAEMSKSVIVSAYDLEPDAYLTKPISAKEFVKRITNLLLMQHKLMVAYKAVSFLRYKDIAGESIIEKQSSVNVTDIHSTIDFLNTIIASIANPSNKLRNNCSKMLGRLYLSLGDTRSAEKLYRQVLEVMPLDWAKVGMVKIKCENTKDESVTHDLEKIIEMHPFCLEAYDQLIYLHESRHDKDLYQQALVRVTRLTPYSILRQENLGYASLDLNDVKVAASAFLSSVKLGRFSIFDKFLNYINLGRATSLYLGENSEADPELLRDTIKELEVSSTRFELSEEQTLQLSLVQSQMLRVQGNKKQSDEKLEEAAHLMEKLTSWEDIDTEIDIINSRNDSSQKDIIGHTSSVEEVAKRFKNDDLALQKLDKYLEEPLSKKNRMFIAKINKAGIDFYDKKIFVKAIDCFEKAIIIFPRYLQLHLNLAQALHAYCESKNLNSVDTKEIESTNNAGSTPLSLSKEQCFERLDEILSLVSSKIDTGHSEYNRYHQLQEMYSHLSPAFDH